MVLLKLLVAFLIAVGITLLVRKFFLYVTEVYSNSMLPTLQPKNLLLTVRVYHPENLKRGEIIVFYSHEKKLIMIKRLIGLPGDLIQIEENGDLLINGNEQEEPYVRYNGGKVGSFSVLKGEYFFLGDNRAESNDSRHWKNPTIPAKDIQGKVMLSLHPKSLVK